MLGALLGAGIGVIGGVTVGSMLFAKKQPKDFSFLDVDMDSTMSTGPDDIPIGPVPRDFREALEFTPMWTRWPDYERVAWINYAIKVLWPHYNKAITEIVVQALEPQLKQTVKKVGVLECLEVECLDLGNKPLRIGGIKVYETNDDEVILEAPILWGSDMKIRISAKVRVAGAMIYVPVEVGDVVLKAESRITIKPLVETLPCLGAVTISLLKEPFVDLSLMLINRLDLMALPVVRDIAHQTVKNIVGDMLVFPNQMSFDIMPNGGRPPEPEGMLTVKLVKGTALKSAGDLFSKCDPFVVLEVREGRAVHSTAAAGTNDPEWDEEFYLIVDDRKQQALTLMVKDEDFGWQDKPMGYVRIPLEGMPFMENTHTTYEVVVGLQKPPNKEKAAPKRFGPKEEPLEEEPPVEVRSIRMKNPRGWEDVPLNFLEGDESMIAAPRPTDDKKKSSGKNKNDRGDLTVEVTFQSFNRKAMAKATEKKENPNNAAPAALDPTRNSIKSLNSSNLRVARGVLTVTLTRCINLQGDGSTDPQVVISLYDETAEQPMVQKSSVVYNEQSPRWGDKFDFVGISADSFLVFNVKDFGTKEKSGDKKSLGKLRIPVPDVVRNVRIKDVWALQETQQGEIALTMEWKALALDNPGWTPEPDAPEAEAQDPVPEEE